jgi:cobalt-zinc-cadmium efflux system outer membrane protein
MRSLVLPRLLAAHSNLLPLALAALSIQSALAQPAALPAPDDGRRPQVAAAANPPLEPAGPLSLATALTLAFEANPELAVASREVEATEAAALQAGLRPNPELSALLEDTRRESRTVTLLLSQPVELGGKRAARMEAAERARELATADLTARRAELHADVTAAFFDLLIAQERARLAAESAELARRATTAATRRVAAGKISPVEETKARVAEAGVKVELAQAASELRGARRRLAALWGNPAPRFEAAEGPAESPAAPSAYGELAARLDAAPTLARAGVEIERRRALVEVERARRVPDLTVSLGVKRDNAIDRDQAVLGVSLPIPLFDRNQGKLAEALARRDQARDERAALRIGLERDAAEAWERLESARTEAAALEGEVLPGARQSLDAATKGFELGKFGFLDVRDAQRTLFQARAQHLRALAAAYRARADLARILGEPAAPAAR